MVEFGLMVVQRKKESKLLALAPNSAGQHNSREPHYDGNPTAASRVRQP
jgi:hypothetical protein